MKEVHVFDASALIALFRSDERAYELFMAADEGDVQVVWPSCAIGTANNYLQATHGAWTPLLMGGVTCTPLAENTAIDAGRLSEDLATGHVVYEARATRGVVVTAEPDRYRSCTLPLRVL